MRIQFQIILVLLWSQFIYGQHDLSHAPVHLAFDNAVNYCLGRFRNLVKIDGAEKNSFVCQYAKDNNVSYYWINANDRKNESVWVDTGNNEISYRNWKAKKPDGGYFKNCIVASVKEDGIWSDFECYNAAGVICEKVSGVEEVTPEVSYENSTEKVVYEDALEFCKGKNMEMVKINNPVTNAMVFEYAKSKGIDMFWINGNDIYQESIWVDAAKNKLPYRNWHAAEPSGGRKENCISGGKYPGEGWDDVACNSYFWAICQPVN